MEKLRKPFQGVSNIVRFNWHFYVGVIFLCVILIFLKNYFSPNLNFVFSAILFLVVLTSINSLIVSYYIYDFSKLYTLNWLPNNNENLNFVNINAGFDETSELLIIKFPNINLKVLDFYDQKKHTEISIKRARKAYSKFPNTINYTTSTIPLESVSIDKVFVIFSAHEIRNYEERVVFFQELFRILKVDGEINVTEHLRDLPNLIAFNIGFLHFFGRKSWLKIFEKASLKVKQEQKLNPFISNFILSKHGITS